MLTVGQAIVRILEAYQVQYVFGIPGVHTIELYRGLSDSPIKHITPRHEQGAGFMADGYARITGKPGVCFVITGPGLTNIITPMAQALSDSIPMVVISTINAINDSTNYHGKLHELPDQSMTMKSIVKYSHTLLDPEDLPECMEMVFSESLSGRPGPCHIEIPVNLLRCTITKFEPRKYVHNKPQPNKDAIKKIADACNQAERILILAGGGARAAEKSLPELAQKLDAPIVLTTNARGICAESPLRVPASPSLTAIRNLIADSDLVIAVGTEFGETDYNIYKDNPAIEWPNLIRIDSCADQLTQGPKTMIAVQSCSGDACFELVNAVPDGTGKYRGEVRAKSARHQVMNDLIEDNERYFNIVNELQKVAGDCILIGDSTQIPYAGNLYVEINSGSRWFNSATGFGALGYSVPASIGAAIGSDGNIPVICIVGDGGIQFTLAELGTAIEAGVSVIFLIWNNKGYDEIKRCMIESGIKPEGVSPTPPDFGTIAIAFGLEFRRVSKIEELGSALSDLLIHHKPSIIEWMAYDH